MLEGHVGFFSWNFLLFRCPNAVISAYLWPSIKTQLINVTPAFLHRSSSRHEDIQLPGRWQMRPYLQQSSLGFDEQKFGLPPASVAVRTRSPSELQSLSLFWVCAEENDWGVAACALKVFADLISCTSGSLWVPSQGPAYLSHSWGWATKQNKLNRRKQTPDLLQCAGGVFRTVWAVCCCSAQGRLSLSWLTGFSSLAYLQRFAGSYWNELGEGCSSTGTPVSGVSCFLLAFHTCR